MNTNQTYSWKNPRLRDKIVKKHVICINIVHVPYGNTKVWLDQYIIIKNTSSDSMWTLLKSICFSILHPTQFSFAGNSLTVFIHSGDTPKNHVFFFFDMLERSSLWLVHSHYKLVKRGCMMYNSCAMKSFFCGAARAWGNFLSTSS